MIKKEEFVPVDYFKKEAYTGSLKGMRYHVIKKEDSLSATVWPEPYSFEATPDTQKTTADFPFSQEGIEEVVAWLNQQYESHNSIWNSAISRRM